MRLWFAMYWADSVPLTQQFRPRKEPPGLVGGHNPTGEARIEADALVFYDTTLDFVLWDVRKELPGCGLAVLAACHGCAADLVELRRKWRWQSVVPRLLVEHFAVDLYNLVVKALNSTNLGAAPPAEQPPQEGEQSHE